MSSSNFISPLSIYLEGVVATTSPKDEAHNLFVDDLYLNLNIGTVTYESDKSKKYHYDINELLFISENFVEYDIELVGKYDISSSNNKINTTCLNIVKLNFKNVINIIGRMEVDVETRKEITSKVIVNYLVYKNYKNKGYILKDGLKYGVDFVMYKNDPKVSHSLYCLLVCNFDKKDQDNYSEIVINDEKYLIRLRRIDWKKIIKLTRLCEAVSKELLLVNYNFEKDIVENVKISRYK